MNSGCQKNDAHVVRRRLLISGLVQGVGFRWEYRRVAEAAGTAGWARNLADGRVEVLLEGPADAVAEVEAWCHTGPRHAVVTGVEDKDDPLDDLAGENVESQRGS